MKSLTLEMINSVPKNTTKLGFFIYNKFYEGEQEEENEKRFYILLVKLTILLRKNFHFIF